ncbi:unnamed protein product [Citrullus colocynthis]|uniref:Uncharacterized protein n=1 Tax=Citrullus colocynthis TaxID=252529 RepID=A0ABP0YKS2_9ROSI
MNDLLELDAINTDMLQYLYPPGFFVIYGATTRKKKRQRKKWPILERTERRFSIVWKKTLDPQAPFLQQGNKIFVVSSVIAVAADPLFFYIPVFDRQHQCLTTD